MENQISLIPNEVEVTHDNKSQVLQLLGLMRKTWVSQADAFNVGIGRLSARIFNIKKLIDAGTVLGEIEKRWVSNGKKRWIEYRIKPETKRGYTNA